VDVLFICGEAPTPAQNRPNGLIAALARRGHSVTLLFVDEAGTAFDGLAEHCRRLLPVRRRHFAEAVHRESATGEYNLVHVDRSADALIPGPLPLPAVLDAVVCAGLRGERATRALGPIGRAVFSARLPHLRREESAFLSRYNRLIVATEDDAAALRDLAGCDGEGQGCVHVVPSPIDLDRFAPPLRLRDPATLLLDLREFGRPEAIAAIDAAGAALPAIWEQRVDVRLVVIGHVPLGAAGKLSGDPRVVFSGAVHDPRGHLMAATIALAPLGPSITAPHGALEALATATPLIACGAVARDLGATAQEELLVADAPAAMARAALALLDDAPFRGRIGRAGRRLVERRHGKETVVTALEDVYSAATGSALAEWRLEVGLGRPRVDE
jgi:glycosyltransferase involved in cell wall biosynthesis